MGSQVPVYEGTVTMTRALLADCAVYTLAMLTVSAVILAGILQ